MVIITYTPFKLTHLLNWVHNKLQIVKVSFGFKDSSQGKCMHLPSTLEAVLDFRTVHKNKYKAYLT